MAKQYFPEIGKIPFEGPDSKNVMAFHYYQPEKVVMGKKMKDWLKFAMAWWHTLGQASATSSEDRHAPTNGTRLTTLSSVPRTRWTLASR